MSRYGPHSVMRSERILTPAFLEQLEKMLAVVRNITVVCRLIGIPRRTFYNWKLFGQQLCESRDLDVNCLPRRVMQLCKFYVAVERGIALGEFNDLKVIAEAAKTNWRAAAWRLTHLSPKSWPAGYQDHYVTTDETTQIDKDCDEILATLTDDPILEDDVVPWKVLPDATAVLEALNGVTAGPAPGPVYEPNPIVIGKPVVIPDEDEKPEEPAPPVEEKQPEQAKPEQPTAEQPEEAKPEEVKPELSKFEQRKMAYRKELQRQWELMYGGGSRAR